MSQPNPLQLVESFIASVEAFRQEHCNPDDEAGWLPREKWFSRYRNDYMLALEGEVRELLIRRIGGSATDGMLLRLAELLQEHQRWTELALENRKNSKEDHRRALRLVFDDAELPQLYGALRDAADGGGATDGQQETVRAVHPATLAKAVLFEQPDISPTELAKKIGVTRSTLYKTTEPWKDVRAILIARGNAPSGYKDEDGNLDAVDDDTSE